MIEMKTLGPSHVLKLWLWVSKSMSNAFTPTKHKAAGSDDISLILHREAADEIAPAISFFKLS